MCDGLCRYNGTFWLNDNNKRKRIHFECDDRDEEAHRERERGRWNKSHFHNLLIFSYLPLHFSVYIFTIVPGILCATQRRLCSSNINFVSVTLFLRYKFSWWCSYSYLYIVSYGGFSFLCFSTMYCMFRALMDLETFAIIALPFQIATVKIPKIITYAFWWAWRIKIYFQRILIRIYC